MAKLTTTQAASEGSTAESRPRSKIDYWTPTAGIGPWQIRARRVTSVSHTGTQRRILSRREERARASSATPRPAADEGKDT